MPLSDQHRHALLLADRTHDVGVVTTVVAEVLTANPETNLLEIEQAFRDGAAAAYLVGFTEKQLRTAREKLNDIEAQRTGFGPGGGWTLTRK